MLGKPHKLVHFQFFTLFSINFPQATSNIEWRGGLRKNQEYVIKSELKDKTLNYPKELAYDCSYQTPIF